MKYCAFCGRSEAECKKLVDGPGVVAICDDCWWTMAPIMELYRPQPIPPDEQARRDAALDRLFRDLGK